VRRAPFLLVAIAVLAAGCRQSFDPPTWVTGLRVLAVRADPPELAAGATATLSVLAVDTEGRTLEYTWDACLLPPPLSGGALNPECLTSDAGAAYLPLGTDPTASFTMPSLALADLGLPDSTGGFYRPVRVLVRAGDAVVPTAYRVRYGLGLLPVNQNPALEGVFVVPADAPDPAPPELLVPLDEGAPPDVAVGDTVKLRATVVAGSAETYLVPDGDPREGKTKEVTELVRLSWYSTAGDFSAAVTGEEKPDTELQLTKYTPTPGADGTVVDLWVVARDERGGTDWTHRTLRLR